jgi:CRP/FNR family transcriptional regulator, cyclic AMP receptor protein
MRIIMVSLDRTQKIAHTFYREGAMAWTALSTAVFTVGSFHVSWIDLIGYIGALVALMTFCMTTMLYLRFAALCTNVLLFSFGVLTGMYPTMVLHLVLFPINTFKILQILRLVGSAERPASEGGLSFASLKPLMTRRRLPAGATLMRKGDVADKLYYLDDGKLSIPEFNKTLDAGAVIGEIGVFAAEQRRTATLVCLTDCDLYELTERRTKELYFQNPAFGFAVMQLIITRLLENQQAPALRIPVLPVAADPSGATLVPEQSVMPAILAASPAA